MTVNNIMFGNLNNICRSKIKISKILNFTNGNVRRAKIIHSIKRYN